MQNTTALLAGLRGHHLFAGLSPPQMQRLLTVSHVDEYEAGHLLFDRGQPAQHFFIVLGSIALKRGRTKQIRVAAFVAALATIGYLVSVARAHHPLGIFAGM